MGVKMTDDLTSNILTYIGLVPVGFMIIRFAWAPYAIWKEQIVESAELRLELSKPERLVIKHLAKHRAKAKIKITKELHNLGVISHEADQEIRIAKISDIGLKVHRLCHQAAMPEDFITAVYKYMELCKMEKVEGEISSHMDVRDFLLSNIHDQISIDELSTKLPTFDELDAKVTPLKEA